MPKMVEKVFFEFLSFTNMKVCLQGAVSKTWLYGIVVSFEVLETFFSPRNYSANNAYDTQNTLEKLFTSDCRRFWNVKDFYLKQKFSKIVFLILI